MKIEKLGSLHGNNIIWRYMSLEKFIDLILNRSIYFANARKMEDKFEMEIPINSLDERRRDYLERGKSSISVKSTMEKEVSVAKRFKENTYVNCWSLNNAESYALWKIYLGGSINGVAIKSTVSKLIHCLETIDKKAELTSEIIPESIEMNIPLLQIDRLKIGEVSYKNHIERSNFTKTNLAITKKEFYEYEKEIRVFGTSNNQYFSESPEEYDLSISDGFHVGIDIDELIDSIVISPYSPLWFKHNLKVLITKLNSSLIDKVSDSEIMINS
ncbi:hypothetical protein [Cyclobacterium qasimii]|nr:hypothetical protein [Cyclobacterium qasimii]